MNVQIVHSVLMKSEMSAELKHVAEASTEPPPTKPWLEACLLPDLLGGLVSLPTLRSQPRGRGEPVLVLPGFGTGDRVTGVLRRYLRALGYSVRGWQLGRNGGDVRQLIPRVVDLVGVCVDRLGRPARLVGWSLGGTLAREVARERPELVEKIVTLGTPVIGGPKYTSVARVYERRGYDLAEIEAYVDERNRTPIETPITAIYSRRDGIVSWPACIDRINPDVEHVEVASTHFGLLVSATALRSVARALHVN